MGSDNNSKDGSMSRRAALGLAAGATMGAAVHATPRPARGVAHINDIVTLDATALERLLCREATLDAEAVSCRSTLPFAMLDHLRLSGRFSVLLQMVKTKAAALIGAPPPPLEPHRQAVLDWYFEHRLGIMRPPSLAAFLTEAGWEDENELLLTVWRDYLFNRISK